MNNDLISREALKKAIAEATYNFEQIPIRVDEVQELIDNAPTVEASNIIDGLNNEIDDLSENLAWYINERNRLLKERRPHGKWITTWDRYIFQCSCCHGKSVKYNFCPECGADMRGEE